MYDTAAFMHVMVPRVKSWQTQLFLICISGVISGCSLPYYWQAVGGQLELLRKQAPIHQILESADTNESTKAALQRIVEARKFAIDELLLHNPIVEFDPSESLKFMKELESSYRDMARKEMAQVLE